MSIYSFCFYLFCSCYIYEFYDKNGQIFPSLHNSENVFQIRHENNLYIFIYNLYKSTLTLKSKDKENAPPPYILNVSEQKASLGPTLSTVNGRKRRGCHFKSLKNGLLSRNIIRRS